MRQTQRTGDNSVNIQGDVVNFGVSYRDAREIAKDVFEENIVKFTEVAREIASERAHELTDKLISSLPIEALESLKDPDVQRSLFFAQQEFACSGEKDLGELLVKLLADRMQSTERNVKTLALGEALRTAPKLTSRHFAALSVLMVCIQTKLGVDSVERLHRALSQVLSPLAKEFQITRADVAYLEYAGCLSSTAFTTNLGDAFQNAYAGLFTTGFMEEWISEGSRNALMPLTQKCLRDPKMIQLPTLSKEEIRKLAEQEALKAHKQEIERLMGIGLMAAGEIEREISEIDEDLADFPNRYNASSLVNCQLTAVGTTLAYTNLKRVVGDYFDAELDIWVY
ncbi:LPO_1073/Vpar_1526 family protein [Streptomyces cyaneofuscatus]|uniref:LPO_1073/Vpar_1526 family protein n=1 Tax=Streptomyces cyaneofuscatus TaxID=66883 RepID=UPI0037D2D3D3